VWQGAPAQRRGASTDDDADRGDELVAVLAKCTSTTAAPVISNAEGSVTPVADGGSANSRATWPCRCVGARRSYAPPARRDKLIEVGTGLDASRRWPSEPSPTVGQVLDMPDGPREPPGAGMTKAFIAGGHRGADGILTTSDLRGARGHHRRVDLRAQGSASGGIAGPDDTTAALAIAAGARRFKEGRAHPDAIDPPRRATATPEQPIPNTGALSARASGMRWGSFDLPRAARVRLCRRRRGSMLTAGGRNVLVIGSEPWSAHSEPAGPGHVHNLLATDPRVVC